MAANAGIEGWHTNAGAFRLTRQAKAKEVVAGGLSLRQAAKVLGVPKSTIYRDLSRKGPEATPQPGDPVRAMLVLDPCVVGAGTLKEYSPQLKNGAAELGNLVGELACQIRAVNGGDLRRAESMLMVQAHTLDAIFNNLAGRAALNMGEYPDAVDRYMRLALKAQSQCRATLETLAVVKNPQPVAFVRQANIGYHQQVNNPVGPAPQDPRAGNRKPAKRTIGGATP